MNPDADLATKMRHVDLGAVVVSCDGQERASALRIKHVERPKTSFAGERWTVNVWQDLGNRVHGDRREVSARQSASE